METSGKSADQFFAPISADNPATETTEVESLCVNCGDNGTTKFLLTLIPFYKEVIISSFHCPHCDFSNNEVQPAGEISIQGIELTLQVQQPEDLNRQIIKSDYCSVAVPQLELEIPYGTQKGEITTIEGILQRVRQGLDQDQARRKEEHPEDFANIQTFLEKIKDCETLKTQFTVKLRDISGHSFIGPPSSALPGHKDERLAKVNFDRTKEENHAVGYFPEMLNEVEEENEEGEAVAAGAEADEDLSNEVLQLPTQCHLCGRNCTTKMKLTKIPLFKEVVIMATDCDHCGSRTNEVKSGGGIEPKGRRISLKVTSTDDLCRDVLKSETCSVEIPDAEMHVGGGILGGKFTTLEGLLQNIKEKLLDDNPLISGDSAEPEMKMKMEQFCQKLDRFISVEVPFTVILDDPAGNSYLQNIFAPDDDPNMVVEDYDRTFEQNDDLGINDMNTEDTGEQVQL